ncbi:MAG TPA: phosphoribosylformylglycinamidine synthase subunit PurS [Thermomicrobiaceae bacterium]|nr:phosphoribosylformylglycinamidine synthase subunit PurS [Thermomicrobiaceae bacterium]
MATDPTMTQSEQRWWAEVFVSLKPVVNDPQGLAVRDGLHMLGYDEVEAVRVGKYIQLWVSGVDRGQAESRVAEMCQRLLANPVIEQFEFRVSPAPAESRPEDGEG